jgi:hypothetical protein
MNRFDIRDTLPTCWEVRKLWNFVGMTGGAASVAILPFRLIESSNGKFEP